MKRFLGAQLLVGSALVAICSPAFAQAPAGNAAAPQPAPSGATAGSSDQGVGEIVVQAQRVSQRLQDVPVAVTPVSARELDNKRLHDLPQITLAVPSLQVTTDNAFSLRGIGSQIFTSNVDSSVGVMVDDVSLGVPVFMSNAAFMDVGQVEALTGPQGLLFGRNASAGLLNIISNKPRLNEISGMASFEYDDRDADPGGHFGMVATGVLNVPTSKTSALRLNVLESIQDPVVDARVNTSPNAQLKQIRTQAKAKWLWEPTSDLTVYVIGDYSRERGIGGIWDDAFNSVQPGSPSAANAAADGVTPSATNLYKGIDAADYRSVNTGGVSINTTYALAPSLTLSNIFAWRAYSLNFNLDSDESSAPELDINHGTGKYNQYSDELRLAFKQSRIDGQVGLFGFWTNNKSYGILDGALATGVPHFIYGDDNSDLTSRSLAAYGQLNFHVTDKLNLIAGGRVTNDHITVHAIANDFQQTLTATPFGVLPVPLVLADGPVNQNYSESRNHTNGNYKIGAQYNVQRDVMFYVTYSTGYKGPAFATNLAYVGQDPYVQPETVTDIEGGIKAVLFDRKLRLNISAFSEKFKNFQAQSFTSSGVSILGNAEGVLSRGIELNSTLKPIKRVTFNYNATLLDSHFTNYSTDPCYTGQSAASCPNGAFFQGAGINTPASSHFTGTLEGIYEMPLGDTGSLALSGNWYHRSSMNFSTGGQSYTDLGGINVFGANLSYTSTKGFTIAVFCKNCTNKIYPNFIATYPGDAALGYVTTFNRYGYNSVRNIGASISYKF